MSNDDHFKMHDAAERVEALKQREARERMVVRIKERMEVLNLNPFSAAKKAGVGDDFVRDILRGKVRNPSAERLGRLAEALECSLYYLMGQEDPELKTVERNPVTGEETEVSPPPTPLPQWRPEQGKPAARLLPIKFELMADAFRKATDVVRPPLGWEAATIPLAYISRECWWELVRDDSVAAVAPPGSLVLVAGMDDSERETIAHGEFVIVTKRLVAPNTEFHLIERSMRRVNYRYPELGMWFIDHAMIGPEGASYSDDVWRETEATAPRKSLRELADAIEDPEERAQAHAENEALEHAIAMAKGDTPPPEEHSETTRRALELMNDPEFAKRSLEMLEAHGKWRPRLVGKVLRVLTPVDSRSVFDAGWLEARRRSGDTPI